MDVGERCIHSESCGATPPFDPPPIVSESIDHVAGPNGQPLLMLTTRAPVSGQPINCRSARTCRR